MSGTGMRIMLTTLIAVGNLSLAYGQGSGPVDGKSNGVPTQPLSNTQAIAELEHAQELFRMDNREKDALDAALPLEQVFRDANDFDHLVDCVFLLGDCYYFFQDYEKAISYMREAADLGYRYFPDQMSPYPLKVIGESQYELGRYEESLATFKERVSKVRRDLPDELHGALFDQAALMINTGDYQAALAVLGESLQENKKLSARLAADPDSSPGERVGASMDAAEIIYHAGVANFHLEKLAEAKAFIREALAIFDSVDGKDEVDVRDRRVTLLDELVQISEALGETEDAEQYRARRDELNQ
ncbi:tetratricopeptide repeat protein [bacterium]|nr:tetratricopeptide repeat protein [bacterium]